MTKTHCPKRGSLREVHMVFFTTCGNICGVFHHKSRSPQVLVVISQLGQRSGSAAQVGQACSIACVHTVVSRVFLQVIEEHFWAN